MSSSSSSPRKEQVLVLFASQTGNSEQAALEIADQLPGKLSTDNLLVTSRHMQLDDFLELHQAEWTRLVVIVTSSYGVGQAPLGGYRFRSFCDALLRLGERKKSGTMLEGLVFCLLGLGDSKYTTFFRNPTVTDNALQSVGAKRVGDLGKADASSPGGDTQLAVISNWIDGIWSELQGIVKQPPLAEDRLKEMQRSTIQLCRELDPEFMPEQHEISASSSVSMRLMAFSVLVALLGVAWYFYLQE
jgi:sulfite reductase alpha subunit-like flavoprotein